MVVIQIALREEEGRRERRSLLGLRDFVADSQRLKKLKQRQRRRKMQEEAEATIGGDAVPWLAGRFSKGKAFGGCFGD